MELFALEISSCKEKLISKRFTSIKIRKTLIRYNFENNHFRLTNERWLEAQNLAL